MWIDPVGTLSQPRGQTTFPRLEVQMIGRRDVVLGLAASALPQVTAARFAAIEAATGGRLGVSVLDLAGRRNLSWRASERFPMCSTFKVLAAAAVLARVDRGAEQLDRRIAYSKADLVPYSPVTETHAGDGMTLSAICEAAVTVSDNGAGNLILRTLGGPEGLTAWLRSIGDGTTRLDRWETALNEAGPGDPRDTSTPQAMTRTLKRLLTGRVLSPASRDQLASWMMACQTGGRRLRSGLPAGWRVGDKTGSGENGTTNDVAVAWPPGGRPLLICAFLTGARSDPPAREAALAEVARVASGA